MAGRCHRTYSRKKAAAPPISQFDRLISESGKGTHPVASKTAGHVGKWGITSFTSLRSINGTYGKEDATKRNSSVSITDEADPFSFESDKSEDKKNLTKRRKFFKSRDAEAAPSEANTSSLLELPDGAIEESISKTSKILTAYSAPSKDRPTGSSIQKAVKETKETPKPGCGIKLKIFKSRNSDTYSSDTYSSVVHLPSDDSSSSSNGTITPPTFCVGETINKKQLASFEETTIPVSMVTPSIITQSPTLRNTVEENSDSLSLSSSISNFEFGEITNKKSEITICSAVPSSLDTSLSSLTSYTSSLGIASLACEDVVKSPTECYSDPFSSDNLEVKNIDNDKQNINFFSESAIGILSKPIKDIEPCKIEEQLGVKEDVRLFCTDFDEDEIIDRTFIEYPAQSEIVIFNEQSSLSRADTLDLEELPPVSSTLEDNKTKVLQSEINNGSNSVLSKKKSIFKSRQKEGDLKKRATYKHKWHGHEEKESLTKNEPLLKSSSMLDSGAEDPFDFGTTTLTKMQTWPSSAQDKNFGLDLSDNADTVVSVKCPRQAKKFYTVIKNVKKTHQLQESGEFQEFNDDVEYFLDALKDTNSSAMRCLASLNLAHKCMVPAFRMHLRAHATVTKFFRSLLDAPSHPYLAECAAMVMFALSQDRLNMDLDRCSLELMLNLLDTDSNAKDITSQLPDGASIDHASKIKCLCKELQLQGHAKHLKLEDINAGTLAMETLLSLTSKRAGEWFKEELRMLGGVDHLVRTVTSNAGCLNMSFQSWTPSLLEKLSKIDRCLKVLENITHQNESNQEHLLNISDGQFAKTLMQLFWLCHREVPLNPETSSDNKVVSKAIITMLITTIKVLINLTHGSRREALGSKLLGKDEEIYMLTMNCLLLMPVHLTHDTKFEIQVLSCCLLLNLVEKSEANREHLMKLYAPDDLNDSIEIFGNDKQQKSAMSSLINLFYLCEESAREQEAHTDHIIEKDLDQDSKEEEKKDEDIEETVARLLQKAGRHMEDTLIAAYTALLAGYCLLNNKEYEEVIRSMQPEGHFKTMVSVLKKFLHFMNLTATTSLLRSLKPTEQVVKYMESLDKKPEDPSKEKSQMMREKEESLAFDAFGF